MRIRVGAALAILLVLFFFSLCLANSKDNGGQGLGGDVIAIDAMLPYGERERPPVLFPHDRHAAYSGETGCLSCHDERSGDGSGISFAFKGRKGLSGNEIRDLYHTECIRCHAEGVATKQPTGPQICGGCHVRDKAVPTSSSYAIDFDDSLHFTHTEKATLDCRACHDLLNGDDSEKSGDSMSPGLSSDNVSHDLCITCHLVDRNHKKPSGPLSCKACHALPAQSLADLNPSKDVARGGEVLFDHDLHEMADISCDVCHHKEPDTRCSECHTDGDSSQGGGISLYAAMHTRNADRSCIGCHDEMGAGDVDDCTGCHAPFRTGNP
ncbi:cytochrome c3 family protein [Desulfoluna sp.]|uniref:cytochrome c3 family protein n=1 Tax=Desulfoluna sp. TaxID=2045199 RepID=UPI00262483DD|nr:cytochrome c3 family protein [Desulfoluna sp.]